MARVPNSDEEAPTKVQELEAEIVLLRAQLSRAIEKIECLAPRCNKAEAAIKALKGNNVRFGVAEALRDWIHEQPWSECGPGADTCPDWPVAFEIRNVVYGVLADWLPEQEDT